MMAFCGQATYKEDKSLEAYSLFLYYYSKSQIHEQQRGFHPWCRTVIQRFTLSYLLGGSLGVCGRTCAS